MSSAAPPPALSRLGRLLGDGPYRCGDQVAAVQRRGPVVVRLEVLLVGDHLDEGGRRRVLDDQDRVPPRPLTVAYDDGRGGAAVTDRGSDALQVRGGCLRVPQIALQTTVFAEFQQVDHHQRGVGRSRGECGELFRGGLLLQCCAHLNLLVVVNCWSDVLLSTRSRRNGPTGWRPDRVA